MVIKMSARPHMHSKQAGMCALRVFFISLYDFIASSVSHTQYKVPLRSAEVFDVSIMSVVSGGGESQLEWSQRTCRTSVFNAVTRCQGQRRSDRRKGSGSTEMCGA